jgi:hypothetical protein
MTFQLRMSFRLLFRLWPMPVRELGRAVVLRTLGML